MSPSPLPSINSATGHSCWRGGAWGVGLLWCAVAWRAWGTPLAWLSLAAAGSSVVMTLGLARQRSRLAQQLTDERAARAAQATWEALLHAALAADVEQVLAHSAALLGVERAWLSSAADLGGPTRQWPLADSATTPAEPAEIDPWWQAAPAAGEVFDSDEASSAASTMPFRCTIAVLHEDLALGVMAFEAATRPQPWGDSQRQLLRMLAAILAPLLLRQSRERVWAAAQAQGADERRQFVATLNHKLRTPMTTVLGFAQLLSYEQGLADEHRAFVAEIETAGRALLAMLNDTVAPSQD